MQLIQIEVTLEEVQDASYALNEIFEALPKTKRRYHLGYLNKVGLLIDKARSAIANSGRIEVTLEEVKDAYYALNVIFNALSKTKTGCYLGHLNEVGLLIGKARSAIANSGRKEE